MLGRIGERRFGDFTRSVALPQGCGEGDAQAHYANGTLEVHVKKPEQSKPRRVPVTTDMSGDELDAEDAWRTVRHHGVLRVLRESFLQNLDSFLRESALTIKHPASRRLIACDS